ncbi:MAG TPA: type II toxin-antitoxin system prevent-host-death family antitoxin [Conexibacter sp.]|nr:type II toxin-antitoxin system prevent-host-death family antitoxin [Conexibacter sp.]
MPEVGMHEAKTHLSQLVERALAGEEIVVTRRGKPAVRLTPVGQLSTREALYDCMAGEIEIYDDFDELPDDIAEAFGAR